MACRAAQVGVLEFVHGAEEVAGLDVAFDEQGFDQVVGLAQLERNALSTMQPSHLPACNGADRETFGEFDLFD